MHTTHVVFIVASLYICAILTDGRGFIEWSKTIYHPTYAFAYRGVIKSCPLLCTPDHGGDIFGMGHSTTTTPPNCYTSDPAFQGTMALCLDTYCPLTDNPPMSLLEDYWNYHLATGTVGEYQWQPNVSYTIAIAAVREDEARARSGSGSNISNTDHTQHRGYQAVKTHGHGGSSESWLNVTSFVAEADWQKQYNGLISFVINETGHSTYTITVTLVGLFLPVVLSPLRFIPGLSRNIAWASLKSMLIHPAVWGRRHREPRGQSLYIFVISFPNITLLLAPYHMIQPQSNFASREEQEHSTIGSRAGVMALVTDWSQSTYLLLHRWLGYWIIIHTVIHSMMLLEYYKKYGDYAMALARPYWIWGIDLFSVKQLIVGTIEASAIWPASLLIVRQRLYEVFLTLHHILAVLFLVGFYYHIWYVYNYNWGYEIWAFIAIAIWAINRLWRLARMALRGVRTTVVTALRGTDGEYLRIEIGGVHTHSVVYLCFPALSWMFWENHPFSVASSFAGGHLQSNPNITMKPASPDPENLTGVTARLAARLAAGASPLRIPVLLDGSYHSNITSGLSDCASLLIWGVRKQGLVEVMAPEISQLSNNINVSVHFGKRMDIAAVFSQGLAGDGQKGPVGVFICGPRGMADEVQAKVSELGRSAAGKKLFVSFDEAFSW
ncbi:hypothetical protein F5883DRAFT_665141 [Diaporthe sp. PMI_573]|nr:hypothetical protein F5883DRAFT_665141 [Diaporthaceae sp. PMI_573]